MNRITCLVEDKPSHTLMGEHGLSLYIEGERDILFDTGQSSLFAENASILGLELGGADAAIISHGHYDHGGGLRHFMGINDSAEVFMGEGAFRRRYAVEDSVKRFIGIPEVKSERINFVGETLPLGDGYTLLKDFGGRFGRPAGNRTLFMKTGSGLVPDSFQDEIVLVIESGREVHIITGCSHSGILNIIEAASQLFPDRSIGVLAGGFHLSGDVSGVARGLAEFKVREIYTGHCTSEGALHELDDILGNVRPLRPGTVIEL